MKGRPRLCLGVFLLALGSGASAQVSDPLDRWELVAQQGGSIRGLAYKDGVFVAVGTRTNILVSSNGVDWRGVAQNLGDLGLLAVDEGAGQFLAVGVPGRILSSADGVEWVQRHRAAAGEQEEYWAVTYGGGQFVVVGFRWGSVGSAAIALTSPDGIQWQRFVLDINTTPRNVVYGNGLYVAAGSLVSMYSTNGRDWTALSTVVAQGAAFGGGQFVATLWTATNGGYRSSDGLRWTQMALPGTGPNGVGGSYYTATHANGVFMIGGFCEDCSNWDRPSLVATSTDGVRWTPRSFGAADSIGPIRDIVFVDGRFYLGDQWGGRIWRSARMEPATRPTFRQVSRRGGSTVLSLRATAGFHYVLECAGDILSPSWQPVQRTFCASGEATMTVSNAPTQSCFYRLRVE